MQAVLGRSRSELLELFFEGDPRHDGTFVVGVVTTRIYCLPSCPAKKPKPENVRFFPDEKEAAAFGLRACRRCRPDHFYRRFDPGRELVRTLAERVRARPEEFADVRALCAAANVGKTRLTELFRRHYHQSPADFLLEARIRRATRALARPRARVIDAGLAGGFESSSTFHENFRRSMGLAPGAYHKLASTRPAEFVLQLPAGFRAEDLFAMFGRDIEGLSERVRGRRAAKALVIDGQPVRVELAFAPTRVRVRLSAKQRLSREAVLAAHGGVRRMLNLASDPADFERTLRRRGGHARLIRGRAGLRVPQTADLFEGLVWVIVGQQVNVSFAALCRRRLIELAGEPAGDGMVAHPGPAAVAELDVEALKRLQFSGRKAEYLIGVARQLRDGELDPQALQELPADVLDEELRAVRGLGPWSAQYLLMRSFALADCVPVGDAGLVLALQRYFDLEERPGPEETLKLMAPFAPYRSLATFHLWKTLST